MTHEVPELSLKAYTAGDAAAREAFADELMRGLQDYGFIILKDHGVSTDLLAHAYSMAQQVFALPDEVKRRYAKPRVGYTPFGVEHAKDYGHPDLKEFWQIGQEPIAGAVGEDFPENVWPAEAPGFRETFLDLFEALNETGVILLRALAPKLGLDERHFDPLVKRGNSILRVLHYPPLAPDVDPRCVRAAAHEDINLITIMVAAKGAGLELLDRDGSWLPVETEPTNLIVDTGDMLARMTNFVLPATTHRVVNPAGPNIDRYSMPFFMHPTPETSLKVIASCIGDGAKMPEITAGDYLDERLREIGLATRGLFASD
jgi:isopenicillin N synthase-like dioxygenase